MDFDPRDYDSRNEDRFNGGDTRGGRDTPDGIDCDGDSRQPAASRERNGHARTLGRGPGSSGQGSEADGDARDRRDDVWCRERERDTRERNNDARDVFTRHVDLPRGPERELLRDRDRTYALRGSEARTLATVGAFRVVSSRDLRDNHGRHGDPRSGDLRHLREQKLIETVRLPWTSGARGRVDRARAEPPREPP